jgi:hypothetical protein
MPGLPSDRGILDDHDPAVTRDRQQAPVGVILRHEHVAMLCTSFVLNKFSEKPLKSSMESAAASSLAPYRCVAEYGISAP